MICPSCGEEFKSVPMGVAGDSGEAFRCYRCGGFWVNGWMVNRINSKILDRFAGEVKEGVWVGSGACPTDGTKLERFVGESVPMGVTALRCSKCGWWWFPGDNLFKYKPAQEAKINYFKSWGLAADVSAMLLPVLTVAVLLAGTYIGLQLVKTRQQVAVPAVSPIKEVSMTYVGGGVELVGFTSAVRVTQVEYRRIEEVMWRGVEVTEEGGFYMVRIENLTEELTYKLRILDQEYEFVTR